MSHNVKELVHQAQSQTVELVAKGGIGVVGTFTTMSINDLAGLIVAILTGIYMCFQIESAWRNRKSAKMVQKSVSENKQ